uniref:Photosystem I reaction center subunit M n=1 Tax=Callipsygma wilsonis TaxID=2320807 RepID=A0A386B033_9CHLO|nr:photosystem I reaction center subunit M [Callipsygma wilsonis]AYC65051.1 photosystem I reaction center subunit M [Callipsygma wilsonis]
MTESQISIAILIAVINGFLILILGNNIYKL